MLATFIGSMRRKRFHEFLANSHIQQQDVRDLRPDRGAIETFSSDSRSLRKHMLRSIHLRAPSCRCDKLVRDFQLAKLLAHHLRHRRKMTRSGEVTKGAPETFNERVAAAK